MKKKIIITLGIIIAVFSYGVYWAFFDTNRLPKETYFRLGDFS